MRPPPQGIETLHLYLGSVIRRCRAASNKATPAATDTLRLSTCPAIGMRATRSHDSLTSLRRPVPSAPSTMALGSVQSTASYDCAASPASPTVQTPSDFS